MRDAQGRAPRSVRKENQSVPLSWRRQLLQWVWSIDGEPSCWKNEWKVLLGAQMECLGCGNWTMPTQNKDLVGNFW